MAYCNNRLGFSVTPAGVPAAFPCNRHSYVVLVVVQFEAHWDTPGFLYFIFPFYPVPFFILADSSVVLFLFAFYNLRTYSKIYKFTANSVLQCALLSTAGRFSACDMHISYGLAISAPRLHCA